jgi:hypothetical protein
VAFAVGVEERLIMRGRAVQDFLVQAGSLFVNYFSRFGRPWQVHTAAESGYRTQAEDVKKSYVRNAKGEMLPLSSVVSVGTREGRNLPRASTSIVRSKSLVLQPRALALRKA